MTSTRTTVTLHDIFNDMDFEGPSERPERPCSGRVPLNQIDYGSAKFYTIGEIKWTVHIGNSITHNFNQIRISTESLKEDEYCHVELEVYAPKFFPSRMMFWHLFDFHRRTFCIPYPDSEQQENRSLDAKIKATEGTLEKRKGRGPFIRFAVTPKQTFHQSFDVWTLRNHQFPFADLVLRVGNEEIYVNKKILSATSRFFMYIIGNSRLKMIKNWEVLHVKDVTFTDLYDLVGYVYNEWKFDFDKALHLQQIAEQFGVMMHANNAEDFEGRTSLDCLSRRCYDGVSRDSRCMWQEVYYSSDDNTSTTSVFEKTSEEEEEEEDDEDGNSLDGPYDNEVDMVEAPDSPSRAPVRSPSSSPRVFNRDFSQQFDVFTHRPPRVSHERRSLVSSPGVNEPPDQPAPPLPSLVSEMAPFQPNNPYLIETRQGTFMFTFNIHGDGRYMRGHKEGIDTSFGRWDVYMYRQVINGHHFLSMGIYVNDLSPVCNYDTEIRLRVNSQNRKPVRKILSKVLSSRQNTLGYPNFMPWGDALNMADGEKLTVTMHVVLKVTDMPMPVMHYDAFPGRKDVLVMVDGSTIPVSRDVLSEASPVFRDMFGSGFVIDRAKVYPISCFTYYLFILTLDIIYNRVTEVPREVLETLMELAIEYKIQVVIDHVCREYVDKRFFTDRETIEFARKYNLKKVIYAHCNQQKFYNINRSEALVRK